MTIKAIKRFQELRQEEDRHLTKIYDLNLEADDLPCPSHWLSVRTSKENAIRLYNKWWKQNREEYESLRKELCP